MMKMEFIDMKTRNNVFTFIVFLALIFLLTACKNSKDNGLSLQKFEIVDKQFQNLLLKRSTDIKEIKKKNHTLVLELNRFDYSIPEFWFSYQPRNRIPNYIFKTTKRIVGYLDFNDLEIILLSNIDLIYDFETFFYDFLIPTEEIRNIEYLYFPNNLYRVDEKGKAIPIIYRENIAMSYAIFIYFDEEFRHVPTDVWESGYNFKK